MSEVYGLGFTLRPSGSSIEVRSELGVKRLPASELVLVAGTGRMSSSAARLVARFGGMLALRRGFRVIRFDYLGSRQSKLLRAQLRAYSDYEECLKLARAFVRAASLNKLWILESLKSQGFEVGEEVEGIRELLKAEVSSRDELRIVEAEIAKLYFGGLRKVLDPSYGFEARTRRPPKDCFSAALSYAYTKLYMYTEAAVLSVGLEPRVGFLHVPFRRRSSLALDLAEEFRQPVVDAALLTLFMGLSLIHI